MTDDCEVCHAHRNRAGCVKSISIGVVTSRVAPRWPKHQADPPDRVAVQWAAEREGH